MRTLPGSTAALVLGVLSIPLSFAGHLVTLAAVMAFVALVTALLVRTRAGRSPESYTEASVRRAGWGMRAAAVGLCCAGLLWWLWRSGHLFP